MALSNDERERIIEAETLKFETRRNLRLQWKAGATAGRGALWLWCLAFFLLGYALHGRCRSCRWSKEACLWEQDASRGATGGGCPWAHLAPSEGDTAASNKSGRP